MPRTQLNVRVPETTLSQIEELGRLGYESQSHAVIVAIDRLYTQETKTMSKHKQLRKELKSIGIDEYNMSDGTVNGTPAIFLYKDGQQDQFTGWIEEFGEVKDQQAESLKRRFA